MNKRIRELAHQADLVIKKSNGNDFRFGAMDPKLEKFAELILRECMEVAGDSYTSTPEDCVYYVDLAVNRIAEHFGVEE